MQKFETGMKLYITPKSDSAADQGLVTYIESVLSNEFILLTTPFYKGQIYSFATNDTLHLSFTDKTGVSDFICTVSERVVQDNIHYMVAHVESDISHKQRREMFRMKTEIDGEVILVREIEGQTEWIHTKCRAVDISCGGMGLHTKAVCESGDNVIASLPNGENGKMITFIAEVRWHNLIDAPAFTSHIGVQFRPSDSNTQAAAKKYVFMLQRKILRDKTLEKTNCNNYNGT